MMSRGWPQPAVSVCQLLWVALDPLAKGQGLVGLRGQDLVALVEHRHWSGVIFYYSVLRAIFSVFGKVFFRFNLIEVLLSNIV